MEKYGEHSLTFTFLRSGKYFVNSTSVQPSETNADANGQIIRERRCGYVIGNIDSSHPPILLRRDNLIYSFLRDSYLRPVSFTLYILWHVRRVGLVYSLPKHLFMEYEKCENGKSG